MLDELMGPGGPVMVAPGGGFSDIGGAGDTGAGASRRRAVGLVTPPGGEEVATGDPIAQFPVGREKRVFIDLSTTSDARSRSDPVRAPDWAQSFSAYGRGGPWGSTTVVSITEGPPGSGIDVAFTTPVTLSSASTDTAASRFNACTPGADLFATTTTATAGADKSGEIVFVFSANAA